MTNESDPIYRADCPSREILDQIADKWSMLVLQVLKTLRKLERNGMLTRRILPGPPLGVEYALTPLGRSLQAPFASLYHWTVEHMDTIQQRQSEFDKRS
jgi:DNA-binding HxlR family transcriptional regulator